MLQVDKLKLISFFWLDCCVPYFYIEVDLSCITIFPNVYYFSNLYTIICQQQSKVSPFYKV